MRDVRCVARTEPDASEPEPRLRGGPRNAPTSRGVLRWFIAIALQLVGALYFFQSATLAPDHTDEGLTLQYIDAIARGQWPYYDFVDAYGIVNWVMPVLFYEAFGHRVWGIRMWLVLVKVLSLVMTFVLVKRQAAGSPGITETPESHGVRSNRADLHGALAAVWVAILLGARWPSLQTAYAFITVIPLTLGAWYVVLHAPFRNRLVNVGIAGALTALTIWTKLNAGMYLLAGGLFAYFYWLPGRRASPVEPARTPRWFRVLESVGLVSYLAVFTLCIWAHYNIWFFLYLTLPLVFGLAFAYLRAVRRAENVDPKTRVIDSLVYFVVSAGLSLLVLFGYYGRYAGEYIEELAGIISNVNYTARFPPQGICSQ